MASKLTKQELQQLLDIYFGDIAGDAARTVDGENGGWQATPTPNKNSDGTVDTGFMQINSATFNDFMRRKANLLRANGINSYADMNDPEKNIKMARIIYNEQGWNAWYGSPPEIRKGRPTNETLFRNTPTDIKTLAPVASPTPTQIQDSQIAYPTPVMTEGDINTKQSDLNHRQDIMIQNNASDLMKNYNKKNFVQKLFTAKPVFAADETTKNSFDQAVHRFVNNNFIDNPNITQKFGEKTFAFYGANGHEGTDFHAEVGTNLYGMKGWKVIDAGRADRAYGNHIVIQNPQTGEMLEFDHLKDATVQKGDTILSDKQIIGHTGNSGYRPDGQPQEAHLHVNYYTADGKKHDVTSMADNIQKNPISSAIGSVTDTFKNMFVPQPAQAQENVADSSATIKTKTPQESWADKQTAIANGMVLKGNYAGKSQGTYQIKPGDTLSALAKQYKVAVTDFTRANPTITNPNMIRAGATINVPSSPAASGSGNYVVRSGDNLSTIAKNLGTTTSELARKNNIVNPNLIYTGTTLKY